MYFKINNLLFSYCRSDFNASKINERSVEVPLSHYFLQKFGPDNTIEAGAVSCHYFDSPHRIIDLAEIHPRVENLNALDVDYTGKNVVSISTIEHMCKREYNNGSDQDSITFLEKVIKESDNYLITWGMAYNQVLDDYVRENNISRFHLRRVNWNNEWETHDINDFSHKFGHRDNLRPPEEEGYFNNANVCIVATNIQELL